MKSTWNQRPRRGRVRASAPACGRELAPHEVADLVDRRLAGETRRLPMAAAAGLACDRRHVELVDAGAKADTACGAVLARRLADQDRHGGPLDGAQVVDDPVGV